MATTYYIWKWAENDLPGRPTDVVARLCAGELPPALQRFRPAAALANLVAVASERRTELSELLMEHRTDPSGQTPFIQLCDPAPDSSWLSSRLLRAVWPVDLTLFDESHNRLLGLPKRNVVEVPDEGRQLVDIGPADLPAMLHELGGRARLAAVTCYDRNGNMFQAWAQGQRFAVEWQILPERDFSQHRIWVAGRPGPSQRRTRLGSRRDLFANEALTMADAHRLWRSFLAGAERPATYAWREITAELNLAEHGSRERYQSKTEPPPP